MVMGMGMGMQVRMAAIFQRRQMKIVRLVPVVLSLVLVTACIQEAKWTWTGDTPGGDVATDGVTADETGEVGIPDLKVEMDICIPDCNGKACGDDGCGEICGECPDGYTCGDGTCFAKCTELCAGQDCGTAGLEDECNCGGCDDGNPCTDDTCVQGTCETTDNTEPCDDDDPCTEGDICAGGFCAGTEKKCSDTNPCTNDECVGGECHHIYNTVPCDDGDPCTENDACFEGVCLGPGDKNCDDGNDCTEDLCEPLDGACQHVALDGDACDDGNPCTGEDVCADESCVGVLLPPEQLMGLDCVCAEDADCLPIEDGDACNGTLACTKAAPEDELGICQVDPGTVVTCYDGATCTDDACIPETGACTYTPIQGFCDDGNPCTQDACDTIVGTADGCVHDPVPLNGTPCDDQDFCTDNDLCQGGQCLPGTPMMCDPNPCAEESCDPELGCVYTNIEGPCDDDDPCTIDEHCDNGACISAGILDCDDGKECTDDVCIAGVGCEHIPENEGGECDEGAGICVGGVCTDCVPDCAGKDCGDDGCGGSCGSCPDGGDCLNGMCAPENMVGVPAGQFWMGCNEAVDSDCGDSEFPYHQVDVPVFSIDATEVSVSAYQQCEAIGLCPTPDVGSVYCTWGEVGKEDHPVNCISLDAAASYCEWRGKRLCTEAEWEKAARGTDERIYPWGDEQPTCEIAAMVGCPGDTVPVESYADVPSPYGAIQLAGNVYEWVQDCLHTSYTNAPDDGSAWLEDCQYDSHIWRGGAFTSPAYYLRTSCRQGDPPETTHSSVGFRCCSDYYPPDCAPECTDKECGEDGCGGSCGECGDGDYCDSGLCLPLCGNGLCMDPGEGCASCPADCECDPDLEECTETASDQWVCTAKMISVPQGSSWMGCNEDVDPDCTCPSSNQCPYHEVMVPAIDMDVTEVTNSQYTMFLNWLDSLGHGRLREGLPGDPAAHRLEDRGEAPGSVCDG